MSTGHQQHDGQPSNGCLHFSGSPPNTLWLQYHGDSDPCDDAPVDDGDVTWCRDKIFAADVEYVRAGEVRALLSALNDCIAIPANVLPSLNALCAMLSENSTNQPTN
jgi:hypothetical protein